jgi:hypothetical protein
MMEEVRDGMLAVLVFEEEEEEEREAATLTMERR